MGLFFGVCNLQRTDYQITQLMTISKGGGGAVEEGCWRGSSGVCRVGRGGNHCARADGTGEWGVGTRELGSKSEDNMR